MLKAVASLRSLVCEPFFSRPGHQSHSLTQPFRVGCACVCCSTACGGNDVPFTRSGNGERAERTRGGEQKVHTSTQAHGPERSHTHRQRLEGPLSCFLPFPCPCDLLMPDQRMKQTTRRACRRQRADLEIAFDNNPVEKKEAKGWSTDCRPLNGQSRARTERSSPNRE